MQIKNTEYSKTYFVAPIFIKKNKCQNKTKKTSIRFLLITDLTYFKKKKKINILF